MAEKSSDMHLNKDRAVFDLLSKDADQNALPGMDQGPQDEESEESAHTWW